LNDYVIGVRYNGRVVWWTPTGWDTERLRALRYGAVLECPRTLPWLVGRHRMKRRIPRYWIRGEDLGFIEEE